MIKEVKKGRKETERKSRILAILEIIMNMHMILQYGRVKMISV